MHAPPTCRITVASILPCPSPLLPAVSLGLDSYGSLEADGDTVGPLFFAAAAGGARRPPRRAAEEAAFRTARYARTGGWVCGCVVGADRRPHALPDLPALLCS